MNGTIYNFYCLSINILNLLCNVYLGKLCNLTINWNNNNNENNKD